MEPYLKLNRHPSEGTLELYALGRLGDCQLEQVEEHLLVCDFCQGAVAEEEQFAGVMRAALAETRVEQVVPWWRRIQWLPAAPLMGTVLAAMLLVGVLLQPASDLAPTSVVLRSQRGGPADIAAPGPADAPLDLRIQSSYLTPDAAYRLSIVDENGRRSWSGSFEGEVAHVRSGLAAGLYWVRLYGRENQLLQEYGLRLN